jgi:hypothetical protein
MVKAYARSEKEGITLLTFFHGEGLGTREKYTDWDESFLGHKSEPRMSISLPANTGSFDKKELRILMPVDPFTSLASNGSPHSPIYVQIEEVTQGLFPGDQPSQKVLYSGRVVRSIRNYQGRDNMVGFFALLIKSRLDVPMGLPCNHHCAWALFHGGCGVVEASFDEVGEIDSQDGTIATVTTPAVLSQGASDARFWKRGYLEKDGLRLSIRDYDGATNTGKFYLARAAPDSWIGGTADIRFIPGCDKTVETCRARYNAEEFFMGMGYAIPAYHPVLDSPL